MRLNHRTAIVTGASTGIGAATATALATKGVTVWAVARNRDRLDKVAARTAGIHPIVADITVAADRARLIEAVGEVDILVNNAGIGHVGLVEATSAEIIRKMYEVNVMGLIDMTQRVLPGMLKRRTGHICNVGSTISYFSNPPLTLYASTKYAVEGFTDGLRREVFHRGIGVSLIQPGPVKTAFWDRASVGDRPDTLERSGNGVPPEWVANAIVKTIRFDHSPGYRHVAVPRPLGLGRLLDIPGITTVLDLVSRFRISPMEVVQTQPDSPNAQVISIDEARDKD